MTVLIIILLVIAIPLVFASFLTDKYSIERDIVIDRSNAEVFNYIRMVRNAENYSKWVMLDPAMKKEFRGVDGTVGFVYGWDSSNKNVGKGEQEITRISDGSRIDFELRFVKPFTATSTAYMTTMPTGQGHTKVTWVFEGNRSYMMKVMHFLLNLKKMLGNDLATGLTNLKAVLEKQ